LEKYDQFLVNISITELTKCCGNVFLLNSKLLTVNILRFCLAIALALYHSISMVRSSTVEIWIERKSLNLKEDLVL